MIWLAIWLLANVVFVVFWSAYKHHEAERPNSVRWER